MRNQIINKAKTWLGKSMSNGSHKSIIDIYNKQRPLPRGYKVSYADNWCATFISALAIEVKATDIIPLECSCGQMIELFKKMGSWVENDARVPKVGDIIFYDWDDTGQGDNKGWPEHVGMVAEVKGRDIKVIEGNINKSVGYRNMKVNGKYIRGYGVPAYKTLSDIPTKAITPASSKKDIKWLQEKLNKALPKYKDVTPLKVDGVYGTKTRIAVLLYWESKGWGKEMVGDGKKAGKATRRELEKL